MAEAIALVIGIADPILYRIECLKTQHKLFIENPLSFQEADSKLVSARQRLFNLRKLLDDHHHILPPEAAESFRDEIQSLTASFIKIKAVVKTLEDVLNASETKPRKREKMLQYLRQFTSAGRINESITNLESLASHVLSVSTMLTGFLSTASQLEAVRLSLSPTEQRAAPSSSIRATADIFAPQHAIPLLQPSVVLKFASPGKPTMEGRLKLRVAALCCKSVPRATPVLGVSGMGGLGKTVALLGLGWEADVRERFHDGIYFMRFGKEAEVLDVIAELTMVVRNSGGLQCAEDIKRTTKVYEAVQIASLWFRNRTALFLLDDLCAPRVSGQSFLTPLKQLLADAPESFMLVSTRDQSIAEEAGAYEQFWSREPCGVISREMLFTSAGIQDQGEQLTQEDESMISKILERCAGVPLTISVAGRAIASLYNSIGSWRETLQQFESSLAYNKRRVADRDLPNYPNFDSTIRSSLLVADHWSRMYFASESIPSCQTLFGRLCVLTKHERVTEYVLCKLWNELCEHDVLAFIDRLVELNLLLRAQEDGKIVFSLHELVQEFCEIDARQRGTIQTIYRDFLRAYMHEASNITMPFGSEPSSSFASSSNTIATRIELTIDGVEQATRPWWTLDFTADKGFMANNVTRFLARAGLLNELVGLTSHAAWVLRRTQVGGSRAMQSDFESTILELREKGGSSARKFMDALGCIRDATSDMWWHVLQDARLLPSQIYARLLEFEDCSGLLQRYLKSVETIVQTPWLKPTRRYWPGPHGASFVEVPIGDEARFIGVNWERHVISAVYRNRVEEIDLSMRVRLKSLDFPRTSTSCIALSKNGSVVVLSTGTQSLAWDHMGNITQEENTTDNGQIQCATVSDDGCLIVIGRMTGSLSCWDRRNGHTVFRNPKAHKNAITAVAVCAHGTTLVSGDDIGSLKVWDYHSGELRWHTSVGHADEVNMVSRLLVRADGGMVVSVSDTQIRWWSLNSNAPLRTENLNGGVSALAFSTDGSTLVCGDRLGSLQWRNGTTGDVNRIHTASRGSHDALAVSACGKVAWCAGTDRLLRSWHRDEAHGTGDEDVVGDGIVRPWFRRVVDVAVSTDGKVMLSLSGGNVQRVMGSKQVEVYGNGDVRLIAMSADGMMFVLATDMGLIWHDGCDGKIVAKVRVRQDSWVWALCMSGDGRRTISFGRDGKMTWRKGNGNTVHVVSTPKDEMWRWATLATSHDGRRVASGFFKSLVWWDEWGDSVVNRVEWMCEVKDVAVSADGRRSAAVDCQGGVQVRVWPGHEVLWWQSRAHCDLVRGVGLNADGSCVVSAGQDGWVRMWKNERRGRQSKVREHGGNKATDRSAGTEFEEMACVKVADVATCVSYAGARDGARQEWVVVGDVRGGVWKHELVR